jgi:hypothetical protein
MRRTALLLVLALVACGQKARPLPPELVQPEAPGMLVATSTPDGVRLVWRRPDKYTSGKRMNDLGSFIIERAPGEETPPVFTPVGRFELTDRDRFRKETRIEWIDHDVVAGDHYLYRVTGVTTDGYHSAPAGPLAVDYEPPPPGSSPTRPSTEPGKPHQ